MSRRVNHADPKAALVTKLAEPLFSKHSLGISINKYFTDVDGNLIKANNALVVNNNLNVDYPFWLFGAFDHLGGYALGNAALPPKGGALYLSSFVNGVNTSYSITQFSGFNTIQANLKIGDIVHVFTNSFNAPQAFIWIVQSAEITPLASIVLNSMTTQKDNRLGKLYLTSMRYATDNVLQWNQKLEFIFPDNIGDYRTDSYNPAIWRTPQTGFTNTLEIKLKFNLDQYIEIGSYLLAATTTLDFNFTIEKIQTELTEIVKP